MTPTSGFARDDPIKRALLIRSLVVLDGGRIIETDDGRIAEQGSHADLLAACGPYARLYTAQANAYAPRP
ncbi:hypothetical protein [Nonomuraea turcica]|uniref:hypothetical protein n=1 Tax=Nonomuraea sp. G32 TaxID=3067274 RepID=UPI00273C95B6|nr:hypothetical protein [Nonomuraea sp. G32]MDP4510976.1 hypothetical protein [Nonomuraea sp. G32]